MKKIVVFLSIAAVMASACSKSVMTDAVRSNQVAFQTIAGLNTKATPIVGTVFPQTETFSTYAWAEGTVGEYFMDNITIAYFQDDTLWKAQGETFYWPKNSTVDFISYYPTGLNGITVKKDSIIYSGIDVKALQQDIMYADKAAGFSDNADLIDDSISGFTGVPTIFRHALAKVNFKVALTYIHKEEADGTVTDWEVKINNAKLSGIYTKGGCELKLASDPAIGVIGWEKPFDADSLYHVWTPEGTPSDINGALADTTITPGILYSAVDTLFVLPQLLTAGQQKVTLNVTVKTTRNGNPFLNETFDVSANIRLADLPAWEMNHIYTYILRFGPTSSNGNGGNPIVPPSDPDDPDYPGGGIDPNDPDLSDAIITFDPAVDGWQNVGIVANITL